MFCGLGEVERTRFKTQKKRKKVLSVGKDEMVSYMTYNHVKYFLPYLSRF